MLRATFVTGSFRPKADRYCSYTFSAAYLRIEQFDDQAENRHGDQHGTLEAADVEQQGGWNQRRFSSTRWRNAASPR